MKGCSYVLHIASPFFLKEPHDENLLITPAVEGTLRVIKAAKSAGVKRLVLTSSTFAIIAGKDTGKYGPNDWSDINLNIGAYAKSKTLAERAAWKAVKGSNMEMTAILPGAVFGPPLGSKAEAQNVKMMKDLIAAMIKSGAAGKRFIACSAEPIEMSALTEVLKKAGYKKAPTVKAPTFLLKFISLFDREVKGMLPFIGKKASYDNSETFKILDWKPTPMSKSFEEMATAITVNEKK